MTVVDASIVVRLLQNRRNDADLRERFSRQRHIYAPALIDAEVTSAIRGLLLTSTPAVQIGGVRAQQMLDDFADLPLVRYPMQAHQRRALALRDNCTAYDAFYLALAESLSMPLLTDNRKYGQAPRHKALIETWSRQLVREPLPLAEMLAMRGSGFETDNDEIGGDWTSER